MKQLIPPGWTSQRLGEVARVVGGGTPSRGNPEYWDGEIPWATPTDLTRLGKRYISATAATISSAGLQASAATLLPPGSVLMTSRATLGVCAINLVSMATNQGFQNLIPSRDVVSEFLIAALTHGKGEIRRLASGSTFLEVSRRSVMTLPLLVPPVGEQRKIAAILSSVDDAIEATQAVIDELQVVKKTMMAELLTRGLPRRHTRFKQTEIGEVPEEWEVVSLETCLSRLIDYRGKSPPKADHGAPLITAKNVRDGYINVEPREYIVLKEFDRWMSRGLPNPGDVLFTTEAPLGKAAAVPTERIALGQRLITLCPDRTRIDPVFFLWMLLGPHFQILLLSKATGSTVQGIKQSVLRKLLVAVPSLEEQRSIGQLVQSVADREGSEQTNRIALEHLKSALMSVLVTGEVRVTPDKAPA